MSTSPSEQATAFERLNSNGLGSDGEEGEDRGKEGGEERTWGWPGLGTFLEETKKSRQQRERERWVRVEGGWGWPGLS